jgi:hypothetical protein
MTDQNQQSFRDAYKLLTDKGYEFAGFTLKKNNERVDIRDLPKDESDALAVIQAKGPDREYQQLLRQLIDEDKATAEEAAAAARPGANAIAAEVAAYQAAQRRQRESAVQDAGNNGTRFGTAAGEGAVQVARDATALAANAAEAARDGYNAASDAVRNGAEAADEPNADGSKKSFFDKIGDFFKGMELNGGSIAGGVLGAGAAWLVSSIFGAGAGPFKLFFTVLTVPLFAILGATKVGPVINNFFSGIFNKNGQENGQSNDQSAPNLQVTQNAQGQNVTPQGLILQPVPDYPTYTPQNDAERMYAAAEAYRLQTSNGNANPNYASGATVTPQSYGAGTGYSPVVRR